MWNNNIMNHLCLFSDIGTWSLGFEKSNIKTIAFCEKDKDAPLCPIFVELILGFQEGYIGQEIVKHYKDSL